MERQKTLGFKDLVLFIFCAMFGIEAIASVAAIGPSVVFWWIICALGFALPLGLISAELGSTYPDQGGIYVWTREALGGKWAARLTWYYWIAIPLWIPAIYISVSEIIKLTLSIEIGLWIQVLICIALIWATVGVNLVPLVISKWVPNAGAIARFLIIVGIIVAAIAFFARNGSAANDIRISDMLPRMDAVLISIPVIVYHLFGFELITGSAGEMRNPTRDIPRAIILSIIVLVSVYLVATIAMWIVVPVSEIDAVGGVFDLFSRAFGGNGAGRFITVILGIIVIFTLFTEVVTWTLGENRVVAEAAAEGELPSILGRVSGKNLVPVGASIVSGIISTMIVLVYGLVARNASSLFWSILAFSIVIESFAYVILFPVYVILGKKDADRERPYQVPGPKWFKTSIAVVAELFMLFIIVVLLIQPGDSFVKTALPIIAGTVLTVIVGEILISRSAKARNAADNDTTADVGPA